MKKVMNVIEVENEGFMSMIGEPIMVFCMSYIYAGRLTGINDECVLLEDASIVYETGSFGSSGYLDAQKLPCGKVYLMKKNIESFCAGK